MKFDRILTTANKVLIDSGEDLSDKYKHAFLLESMLYHFARLVKEEIRQREKELMLKGMSKENNKDLYNCVQSLELGQEIKNYKKLCEILNKPNYQGGCQRKSQLQDFQRYFEYQKIGYKFVITDIFDTPFTKEDKRKMGNNSIYVKYIEVILLHHLAKQRYFTCILRKKQIWNLLGMINNRYTSATMKELQNLDSCITKFDVNHFYQRCNQKLERILFTALNNLKNRKLLSYQEQVIIVPDEGETFLASDSDIRKLDAVGKSVLDTMGLISMIQVFCKFKSREFYDEVNARLYRLYGWNYSFKQYKLIYTPENIIEALPESEMQLQKLLLNEQVVETINLNAENLYTKQIEKYNYAQEQERSKWFTFGVDENSYFIPEADVVDEKGRKIFKFQPCYLEAQKLLAEELLRIGNRKSTKLLPVNNKSDLDELFNQLQS